MMNKIVLCMLVGTMTLLASAGNASAASAAPYALLEGEDMEIPVHGNTAQLIQLVGNAFVTQPVPLISVLSVVTVSCADDGDEFIEPCSGIVVVT